jgi:16S rRNA processing protein RimM
MVKVGKVKDAHGLKGDLVVLIFSRDVSWLSNLTQFALLPSHLEGSEQWKYFKLESAKPYKEGLRLKPEGVVDRTQAEALKGSLFYIPAELLESEEGEPIYLSEIEGFAIVNPAGEKLGVIVGFTSNRAQDLLVVEKSSGGQAEIPFVEDFIVEIKFEDGVICMELPEGIWDLQSL